MYLCKPEEEISDPRRVSSQEQAACGSNAIEIDRMIMTHDPERKIKGSEGE